MTLTIEDSLMKELLEDSEGRTKREIIEMALRDALRERRRRKALLHRGAFDLTGTALDLEKLRAEL
jgi:Arc/MetJ family transcription regulator